MTATKAKLQQHLAACPDREGPEVAALLNDLALLRLEKVEMLGLDLLTHARDLSGSTAPDECTPEKDVCQLYYTGRVRQRVRWTSFSRPLAPGVVPAVQPGRRHSTS